MGGNKRCIDCKEIRKYYSFWNSIFSVMQNLCRKKNFAIF
jgi:hypothetical protein